MRTSRSAALSSKDDPASGAGAGADAGADAGFGAAPIHPHPGNAGALCRARHVLLRRNYDHQGQDQSQDQGQSQGTLAHSRAKAGLQI